MNTKYDILLNDMDYSALESWESCGWERTFWFIDEKEHSDLYAGEIQIDSDIEIRIYMLK